MSARRLLVLCYFFPPLSGGGVHRVLGFTRHLPDHGWSCTVVCAGPEDFWVRDETLMARVREGTEVVRVSGGSGIAAWLRMSRGSGGRRPGGVFAGLRALSDWWLIPDSYAGWSARAGSVAETVLGRGGFDAILSSSPPDSVHLAALAANRKARLPWVADFRDPWMGLHFRRPPTRWHRARQAALETRVLERSDRVLAASATHARRLEAQLGVAGKGKVLHLPNGYEPDPVDAGTVRMPAAGDAFLLVYTGLLSLMPDVPVFLDALHDVLARQPDGRRKLRVRLAGPFDSEYEDRAIALGLKGIVELTGPVAHGEARALQRRADTLLLWKPPEFPTMVPGKLYEYLDAGRPVLALLDEADEAADLVRRAGGVVIPPGARARLADEIERRYVAWKEGLVVEWSRPQWLEDHTRARLAGRLAAVLDELAGARR